MVALGWVRANQERESFTTVEEDYSRVGKRGEVREDGIGGFDLTQNREKCRNTTIIDI